MKLKKRNDVGLCRFRIPDRPLRPGGPVSRAIEHFATYFEDRRNQLLIPWPALYETISTRMVKRRNRIATLDGDCKRLRARQQLVLLEDQEYREEAMDECLAQVHGPAEHYRTLSLADRVIRFILGDINIKVDIFITFNVEDFEDVCRRLGRAIVSE